MTRRWWPAAITRKMSILRSWIHQEKFWRTHTRPCSTWRDSNLCLTSACSSRLCTQNGTWGLSLMGRPLCRNWCCSKYHKVEWGSPVSFPYSIDDFCRINKVWVCLLRWNHQRCSVFPEKSLWNKCFNAGFESSKPGARVTKVGIALFCIRCEICHSDVLSYCDSHRNVLNYLVSNKKTKFSSNLLLWCFCQVFNQKGLSRLKLSFMQPQSSSSFLSFNYISQENSFHTKILMLLNVCSTW